MFFVCCPIIPSVCETKPGISSGSSTGGAALFSEKLWGQIFNFYAIAY